MSLDLVNPVIGPAVDVINSVLICHFLSAAVFRDVFWDCSFDFLKEIYIKKRGKFISFCYILTMNCLPTFTCVFFN